MERIVWKDNPLIEILLNRLLQNIRLKGVA